MFRQSKIPTDAIAPGFLLLVTVAMPLLRLAFDFFLEGNKGAPFLIHCIQSVPCLMDDRPVFPFRSRSALLLIL